MRVLLTGASGFVGHHTARALAAAGHDLRLLARASSDLTPLDDLALDRVDVPLSGADPAPFADAMAGCDAVVHVAGLTIATDRDAFRRVNAQATDALARAAVAAGVSRFCYVSSLSAQGPSCDGLPADPDAPRHPISPYGQSKAEGEVAALALAGAMHVQIIRPPVVYGPRDLGLLPFFRMARWRYIVRVGDGRNRVSVIYGPDLADAIVALLAQPPGGPAIFHISDAGGPYDWRTLIDALAGAFGHRLLTAPVPGAGFAALARAGTGLARLRRARPLVDESRVAEMRQSAWLADCERLTARTGWAPGTSLDAGLAATLRWYRDNGWV